MCLGDVSIICSSVEICDKVFLGAVVTVAKDFMEKRFMLNPYALLNLMPILLLIIPEHHFYQILYV